MVERAGVLWALVLLMSLSSDVKGSSGAECNSGETLADEEAEWLSSGEG